ncbi:MAG: hypothetical protein JXR97_00580 [Planctomycetes bacterium]|nr:hypothetical protein [Planctomycetota bacterium]
MRVCFTLEELSKFVSAFLAEDDARAETMRKILGEKVTFSSEGAGLISVHFPERKSLRRFLSVLRLDIDPEHEGSVLITLDAVRLYNCSLPGTGGVSWIIARYLKNIPFMRKCEGKCFSVDVAGLLESDLEMKIKKLSVDAGSFMLEASITAADD